MENIKLVIWDLDETFWKGTLSEGEVTLINENIEIVKELTNRGIINSISSKNDYNDAKKKLVEAGVWDLFVFPNINWQPKGETVRHIIEECQLRTPNIMFIDDNISNRKEVEHYNRGIITISEKDIPLLLSMPELKGKDDNEHSRLKQYKVLEKKAQARTSYSDNQSFLKDSCIKVKMIRNLEPYKDRILELINRTNQLNFTKKRIDDVELNNLLQNPCFDNVAIHVKDKYGDYGICGFYSLETHTNKLCHFLFSCRILNLGVETYIYQKLGNPTIEIVPPTACSLITDTSIDWLEEVENIEKDYTPISKNESVKILLLGGCDLRQMCHYIDSKRLEIIKEFNYPNKRNIVVHKEHTCYLRAMKELSKTDLMEISLLPFGDKEMFDSILFSGKYDILVYSVLMNYTQKVYKKRNGDYRVAFGGYLPEDKALDSLHLAYDEKNNFTRQFQCEGQQTPQDFIQDLEWLYKKIEKPIIFINGPEISDFNVDEKGAYLRHCEMNNVLDDFVYSHSDRCKLIDLRRIVTSRDDCRNNIRHYQRPVYLKMAEEMMSLIEGERVSVGIKTRIANEIHGKVLTIYRRIKKVIK